MHALACTFPVALKSVERARARRAVRLGLTALFALGVTACAVGSLFWVTYATRRYEIGLGGGCFYFSRPYSTCPPLRLGWQLAYSPGPRDGFRGMFRLPVLDATRYSVYGG